MNHTGTEAAVWLMAPIKTCKNALLFCIEVSICICNGCVRPTVRPDFGLCNKEIYGKYIGPYYPLHYSVFSVRMDWTIAPQLSYIKPIYIIYSYMQKRRYEDFFLQVYFHLSFRGHIHRSDHHYVCYSADWIYAWTCTTWLNYVRWINLHFRHASRVNGMHHVSKARGEVTVSK